MFPDPHYPSQSEYQNCWMCHLAAPILSYEHFHRRTNIGAAHGALGDLSVGRTALAETQVAAVLNDVTGALAHADHAQSKERNIISECQSWIINIKG